MCESLRIILSYLAAFKLSVWMLRLKSGFSGMGMSTPLNLKVLVEIENTEESCIVMSKAGSSSILT